MQDWILEALYDRGSWCSFDELTAAAGSRTRLDWALDHLRSAGHPIEASPAAGVRLAGSPALNARLIERELGTGRVGRHVICFAEVDCTNDTVAGSARQVGSDGLVVLAESQRKGRGRHGRQWFGGRGANILMSVLLLDEAGRLPSEGVTVAAGMATAEGIEQTLGGGADACRLKWPNDVLLGAAKVAGILVERRSSPAGCLIVGIGVNVNARPPDGQVDRPATSLAEHVGEPMDRIPLVRALCRRLDDWVARLAADRHAAADQLRARWAARCGMMGRHHAVVSAGRRYEGRVIEVDPMTGLVLLTDEGTHVHIPAEGATVL